MADRFKVLEADHINDLVETLNKEYSEGWSICGTIQEHGYTKVLLEREPIKD